MNDAYLTMSISDLWFHKEACSCLSDSKLSEIINCLAILFIYNLFWWLFFKILWSFHLLLSMPVILTTQHPYLFHHSYISSALSLCCHFYFFRSSSCVCSIYFCMFRFNFHPFFPSKPCQGAAFYHYQSIIDFSLVQVMLNLLQYIHLFYFNQSSYSHHRLLR